MQGLRERLKEPQPLIGMAMSLPSPPLAQALAANGLDWLMLDMEHGALGIEAVAACIAATGSTRCIPCVRVPAVGAKEVKVALDAGAGAIFFPMVNSPEAAREAVASVKYPPDGKRGWGPFLAPLRWGLDPLSYVKRANEAIGTVLMLEHKDALPHLDAILATPGFDLAFIAPFDLALSLGHTGNPAHSDVQAAIRAIEEAAQKHGVPLLGGAWSAEEAKAKIARGYKALLMGFEVQFLARTLGDMVTAIRKA